MGTEEIIGILHDTAGLLMKKGIDENKGKDYIVAANFITQQISALKIVMHSSNKNLIQDCSQMKCKNCKYYPDTCGRWREIEYCRLFVRNP